MFCATGRPGSRNKAVSAACSAAQEMVSTQEIFAYFGWDQGSQLQKITELCETFTFWHQYLNAGLKMKLNWSQLNITWVLKIKADRNTQLRKQFSTDWNWVPFPRFAGDTELLWVHSKGNWRKVENQTKCCRIKGVQFELFPNYTRQWIEYVNSEKTPPYFNKEFTTNLWTICQWQKNKQKKSKRKQNVTEQKGFPLACQTSELLSS